MCLSSRINCCIFCRPCWIFLQNFNRQCRTHRLLAQLVSCKDRMDVNVGKSPQSPYYRYFSPGMAGDDPVAVPHPDALPDLLLDLVVVWVGGRQHLVQLHHVGRVHVLRLLQVVRLELVVGRLHHLVHLGQALQPHEQVDGGATAAPQLRHVRARVERSRSSALSAPKIYWIFRFSVLFTTLHLKLRTS